MNFRRLILSSGPAWLTRERRKLADGTVVEHENRAMYAVATVLDLLAARIILGVKYALPSLGADDARAQIGRDKRVLRGPAESDDAYDARLITAVDDQREKGQHAALLRQVAGYFSPFAVRIRCVDNQGNWVTRAPDGTIDYSYYYAANWNWANEPSAWARHWIIIYPLETGAFTDSGLLGGGQVLGGDPTATIGTTLTTDQVEGLKRLALDWRPEGESPQAIILALDDASFDPSHAPGAPLPDGTWKYYGKDGGGEIVTARLTSARYIEVRNEF